MPPSWRLVRPPVPPAAVPVLDPQQERVVAHDDGPLLVLAGPGTGKTTTLVEAVAARVAAGCAPDEVLALTFSRKAADELRSRIAGRIGATTAEPAASTFHAFCLAILRRYGARPGDPVRLLSGAERDARLRELLRGNADGEGLTRWPAEVRPALRLRGFAAEVADVLDRARERGLTPDGLAELAATERHELWAACASFYEEYLDVLEARGELDYAGLVAQATQLVDGGAAQELRSRYQAVYVDEYQDTDSSQVRLLRLLAGDGRLLVAVGDPDQAIYAFRGAEVRNILDFPARFPGRDGADAPIISLQTCRRSGAAIVGVGRAVARRISVGRLPAGHRDLVAAGPAGPAPEIRLSPTAAEEAASIADLLRRAHLEDGVEWAEMAVLVRTGRALPVLRRALGAAGVPVTVATDEIPLARDPAVAPLLDALRIVDADTLALTPEQARTLLLSPLGRVTPLDLRALGRALRRQHREALPDVPVPASSVLLRDAVLDPADLATLTARAVPAVTRLHHVLVAAHNAARSSKAPDEVVWPLWNDSGWAASAAGRSARGGAAGRAADRDIDAVLGLFDAATRLEDRLPRAGVSALLEEIDAQEIPAAAMEERPAARGAVRLLTAHRSKGLEWDLVVVAGLQDGVWPDLRRRDSLLEADRLDLGRSRPVASTTSLLADERRLLYVAVSRARRRLVVTAVAGAGAESERPSRFLDELGLGTLGDNAADWRVEPVGERGSLSAPSIVGRLRRTAADATVDADERRHAADLIAVMAAATDEHGDPLVPAAHPDRWWGIQEPSAGPRPVRPVDQPVLLRPSAVESYQVCPRQAFLQNEAGASFEGSTASIVGSIVHGVADAIAKGELTATSADVAAALDAVWELLPVDARWQRDAERAKTDQIVGRLLAWLANDSRTLVGSELPVDVTLDGLDVRIQGRVDRVDADAEGNLVVVDLKTQNSLPSEAKVAEHPQLATYQLAVQAGAFAEQQPGAGTGGAELIQLRHNAKSTPGLPRVQPQPALPPDGGFARDLVADVHRTLRSEDFPAIPNDRCDICAVRTSCPAVPIGAEVGM